MSPDFQALAQLLWLQSWQTAVVAIILLPLASILGKRRPQIALLLCFLVLVKALTPPVFAHRASLVQWIDGFSESIPTSLTVAQVDPMTDAPAPDSSAAATPDPIPATTLPLGTETRESNTIPPTAIPLTTAPTPGLTTTETSQQKPSLTPASIAVMVWGFGALVSLAFVGIRYQRLQRLRRSAPKTHSATESLIAEISQEIGLRRRVSLCIVPDECSPAALGIFRPTILLPQYLTEPYAAKDLRAILGHELTHIRRRDAAQGLLQCIAQVIWWFHPIIWLCNRRINALREICCDAEAIERLQLPRHDYAQTLLNILKQGPTTRLPAYVLSATSTNNNVQRIERLMNANIALSYRTPKLAWILAALLALAILPGQLVTSQNPAPTPIPVPKKPATNILSAATPSLVDQLPEIPPVTTIPEQPVVEFPNGRPLSSTNIRRAGGVDYSTVYIAPEQTILIERTNIYLQQFRKKGVIFPVTEMSITAETEGRARRVNLGPGTRVKKGDPILTLENRTLQSARIDAELNVRAAEAELSQFEITNEQAIIKSRGTLDELEKQVTNITQQLDATKNRLKEFESKSTQAPKESNQRGNNDTFQQRLKEQIQAGSSNLASGLNARLIEAKKALELQKRLTDLDDQRIQRDRELKQLSIDRMRLNLEEINAQLSRLEIRAPIDGIVAPISDNPPIRPGQFIQAGTELARVIQTDQLAARLSLAPTEVELLQLNQPVIVSVGQSETTGEVATIFPTAHQGRVQVIVNIDQPKPGDQTFIPGSSANVSFLKGAVKDILTIGRSDMDHQVGQRLERELKLNFFKLAPSGDRTLTITPVSLGHVGRTRYQILGEFQEGDRLVAVNQHLRYPHPRHPNGVPYKLIEDEP